jgi:hypothetical protein
MLGTICGSAGRVAESSAVDQGGACGAENAILGVLVVAVGADLPHELARLAQGGRGVPFFTLSGISCSSFYAGRFGSGG